MTAEFIHTEKITSRRTSSLFISLTAITFLLFMWKWMISGWTGLATVFLCLFAFFLFSSINYQTLIINLTTKELVLKFGLITWVISLGNIASCRLDEIPWFMKNGGAGVHFMFIKGRYRASFNFLEYPRIVITFNKRIGPVSDISFSTREPDRWIGLLQEFSSTTTRQGNP